MRIWLLFIFSSSYGFFDPFSIYRENNQEPVERYKNTPIYQTAQAIVAIQNDENNHRTCTGFLVGQDTIMTNNHCRLDCSKLSVVFFFENEAEPKTFKCTKELGANPDYDYFIFEIEASPTVNPIKLSFQKLVDNEELMLIGHPLGAQKKIDISNQCKIFKSDVGMHEGKFANFLHQCDTLGGNSGSPVLDRHSHLAIGLHYASGTDGNRENTNYGIAMWAILQDIQKQFPQAYSRLSIDGK